MSMWGFPLDGPDLRHLIKSYLDGMGKTVKRFGTDNLPGKDFLYSFLRRHPDLSSRKANLIKRSRAAVSADQVNDFFDRFEIVAAGVPPQNIFNADETNLQDNPGARKAIFVKGVKYAEKVSDYNKNSISVMFCASATGVLLPQYVVYKGSNVYDGWTRSGPKGCLYSSTTSGWFDSFTFADFMRKVFIPHVRRLPGKKIILVDNLSCHMSEDVFEICRQGDVEFVCLPANSTDKLQPLDVGFFRHLKGHWRKQLERYKAKDPSAKALLKPLFPAMLKELVGSLNPKDHIPNAFRKCGIYPIDRSQVKDRIPTAEGAEEIARHVDAALVKKLELRRYGDKAKKMPRGNKVPAGQSLTAQVEESSEEEEEEEESSEEEFDVFGEGEDDPGDGRDPGEGRSKEDDEKMEEELEEELEEEELEVEEPRANLNLGTHVVAVYEGQWFITEVCRDQSGVSRGYTRLSYMVIRGKNTFAWGPKDYLITRDEDILLTHVVPQPLNSRGHVGLTKDDLRSVLDRMVMVFIFILRLNFLSKKFKNLEFFPFILGSDRQNFIQNSLYKIFTYHNTRINGKSCRPFRFFLRLNFVGQKKF